MKRRILLGTLVRDAASIPFVNGLVQTVSHRELPYEVVPCVVKATYVNCGRNDMVERARELACSEVVMVDSDVGWTVENFMRLCSHDVEIVGGTYARRVPGDPRWAHQSLPLGWQNSDKPSDGSLIPVASLPAGFLRVRMSVFDAIREKFPERHYQHKGLEARCEYFPIGLTEKGSHRHPAEAKLDAIEAILGRFPIDLEARAAVGEILAVMGRKVPANITGEDVGFCGLARAAGFTLWLDTILVLPHYGEAAFPLQETEL